MPAHLTLIIKEVIRQIGYIRIIIVAVFSNKLKGNTVVNN
jgi:hypothetical protein